MEKILRVFSFFRLLNSTQKQHFLSLFILLSSIQNPVSATVPEIWCERPWCNPALFAGVDVKYSRMTGRQYWKQQFPSEYLGPNVYVGAQFHQYFGVAVGYEQSAPARVHVLYTNNDNFFGNNLGNLRFERSIVSELMYACLEYYAPLSFCQDLEGIITIGGGILRTRIKTWDVTGADTELATALSRLSFNHQGIARATLGFQYRLLPTLFLRCTMGYENTVRTHVGGSNPRIFIANNVPMRPFSDMFSGYLGLMFKFGI